MAFHPFNFPEESACTPTAKRREKGSSEAGRERRGEGEKRREEKGRREDSGFAARGTACWRAYFACASFRQTQYKTLIVRCKTRRFLGGVGGCLREPLLLPPC